MWWRIFKKYMWIYCCYIIILPHKFFAVALGSSLPSCTLGHFMLPSINFSSCFQAIINLWQFYQILISKCTILCIGTYFRRNFEPNFYEHFAIPQSTLFTSLPFKIIPFYLTFNCVVAKINFPSSQRLFSISNCNEYIKFQFIIYLISNDTRDS